MATLPTEYQFFLHFPLSKFKLYTVNKNITQLRQRVRRPFRSTRASFHGRPPKTYKEYTSIELLPHLFFHGLYICPASPRQNNYSRPYAKRWLHVLFFAAAITHEHPRMSCQSSGLFPPPSRRYFILCTLVLR